MFSQQVFLQGLGMGASLIMPIGAQNAHVIRTGVSGRHVGLTVAACVIVDITLIGLGMAGLGKLVESSNWLLAAARYGGALFLLWYGLRCWTSAVRGGGAGPAAAGQQAAHRPPRLDHGNGDVAAESARLSRYRGAAGRGRRQPGGRAPRRLRGGRDDGVAAVVLPPRPGCAPLRLRAGTADGLARDRSFYGTTMLVLAALLLKDA
jgi:hypothetical protein